MIQPIDSVDCAHAETPIATSCCQKLLDLILGIKNFIAQIFQFIFPCFFANNPTPLDPERVDPNPPIVEEISRSQTLSLLKKMTTTTEGEEAMLVPFEKLIDRRITVPESDFINGIKHLSPMQRRKVLEVRYPLKSLSKVKGTLPLDWKEKKGTMLIVLKALEILWSNIEEGIKISSKLLDTIQAKGISIFSGLEGDLPSLAEIILFWRGLDAPPFGEMQELLASTKTENMIDQLIKDLKHLAEDTSLSGAIIRETDLENVERYYGVIVQFDSETKNYNFYFINPNGEEGEGALSLTVYNEQNLLGYFFEGFYTMIPVARKY